MKKKIVYVEPVDYFSEETRRKYKLGEYAQTQEDTIKTEGGEGGENLSASSDN